MKISIITPVKNLEKYISETIESVINQKGDFDIEYILMDGNSDDKTLKIFYDYQKQIENKTRKIFCNSVEMKVFSSPDNSMYEALAKGLQMVTGEITAYINGDDFYLPNAFSCVNEIMTENPEINWITGLPIRYNEYGQNINFNVPWKYKKSLILKGYYGTILPFIQQESVFWRGNINNVIDLEKLNNFKLAGDYFIWHSFAKAGIKLFIIDSFLGGNRQRTGQLLGNLNAYFKEVNSIKNKTFYFDLITVYFYWIIEKFAGKSIKKRFSNNRIYYKHRKWGREKNLSNFEN